jgi:hypothetical protein
LISAKCSPQGGGEAGERERNYILSELLNGAGRILRFDVCFVGKEIANFMDRKGYYRAQKIPTLDHILKQMKVVKTVNIIFPHT